MKKSFEELKKLVENSAEIRNSLQQANSLEEVLSIAKSQGVVLTLEDLNDFILLHTESIRPELSDAQLETVQGGANSESGCKGSIPEAWYYLKRAFGAEE